MRAIETIVANYSGTFPNTLGINSSGPSTKDGTELIANLFNDYIGVFPQALLNEMGITPNGNAETATDSQQLDAIIRMMARYGSAHGCIGSPDTDTLHDVRISSGVVPDSTYTYALFLNSGIAKQGDVAWVAGGIPGTPVGGLMGGTWSANTEYGVFLIYNPTTKITDAGISVYTIVGGVANPTFLPAGYTVFQLVDWVKTNGSSEIIQTTTTDLGTGVINKSYVTRTLDINLLNTLTTTARLDVIPVPTGFKCKVNLSVDCYDATSSGIAFIGDPANTATITGVTGPIGWVAGNSTSGNRNVQVIANASRQIKAIASVATVDVYNVSVIDFEFKRF